MNNRSGNTENRFRILAIIHRGKPLKEVEKRRYRYFDTAMPRMLQLAINYCTEGDFITFESIELGFEIGVLRILKKGRFEMEMNPIVKSSPSLLKLFNEDPDWASNLIK